ncbi:MAG: hypothetical protein Q9222_003353 [Ikaeria aurantiellina]
MAAYYYGPQNHHPSTMHSHSSSSHNHHGSRSRRAPRLSASHNTHRQFRGVRSMKELTESPPTSAFRARFEAGRSFDLDDDLEFCPGLLTDDDVSASASGFTDPQCNPNRQPEYGHESPESALIHLARHDAAADIRSSLVASSLIANA